jgi:hypothetical protein
LREFALRATDEDIGHVEDLYFDDDWQVRYFVVNTGSWLLGRQVLISPFAVHAPLWEERVLPVDLTREQVENSPDVDLDQPISRQYQTALHGYYGWPTYWAGGAVAGAAAPMPPVIPPTAAAPIPPEESYTADEAMRVEDVDAGTREFGSDLHSAQEVIGYHIQATDGEIGHVDDFFVSEEDWTIRYVMVDTRNWLPGRKVLIGPDWITDIDWQEEKVVVDHTRNQVKESPEFDPSGPLDRTYETAFYDYYGYPYYWI